MSLTNPSQCPDNHPWNTRLEKLAFWYRHRDEILPEKSSESIEHRRKHEYYLKLWKAVDLLDAERRGIHYKLEYFDLDPPRRQKLEKALDDLDKRELKLCDRFPLRERVEFLEEQRVKMENMSETIKRMRKWEVGYKSWYPDQ